MKRYLAYLLLCILMFCTDGNLQGQDIAQFPQPGKQVSLSANARGRIIDNYWLYLPRQYKKNKKWPIILFLQGSNGVSSDSTTSKNDGPAKYALLENENAELNSYVKDSFIIINPHLKSGSYWDRQWYQHYSAINVILDSIVKMYSGDSTRIYVTGLSRGGTGTWGIGQVLNNRIAAIIPICGAIHGVTDFSCFKNSPIWITHCRGDALCPYNESLNAVNRIENTTGNTFLRLNTASPKNELYLKSKYIFTSFEKEGHDAWSDTYNKVEIYKWLLKQKREE